MLLVILLGLVPLSYQCYTTGLCGGIGYCSSPPVAVAPSCACRASYTCGSYGCFRARARSSKTLQVPPHHRTNSISRLEDRKILQRKMLEREEGRIAPEKALMRLSETAAELDSQARSDPNQLFYDCCVDRHLPDACLSKCHFGSYTKDALTRMYFRQDGCPMDAMKELQFCAAMGRDHRECCMRNGVTTTLAGVKCLAFCDQTPGRVTQLDMSYVPCFDRFENIKACFWHDMTRFY